MLEKIDLNKKMTKKEFMGQPEILLRIQVSRNEIHKI